MTELGLQAFLKYGGPSSCWKAVARSLGPAPGSAHDSAMHDSAPSLARLSTPEHFQQLSFFMAAAVPTRFGHSGRQRLLATVSARDRLRAVAAIYETHPPISRARVRELEVGLGLGLDGPCTDGSCAGGSCADESMHEALAWAWAWAWTSINLPPANTQ